MTRRNSLFNCY